MVLNLKYYWFLKNIFIFGHAEKDKTEITDNHNKIIKPENLILPKNTRLYFLVCYQGDQKLREKWALTTGINAKKIYGANDKTETILTTLLLIHSFNDKFKKNDFWFKNWININNFYRKDFEFIRETYINCNLNYKKTIEILKNKLEYEPFKHFLDVKPEYEQYLDGIRGEI